jgi:hypothetical protein
MKTAGALMGVVMSATMAMACPASIVLVAGDDGERTRIQVVTTGCVQEPLVTLRIQDAMVDTVMQLVAKSRLKRTYELDYGTGVLIDGDIVVVTAGREEVGVMCNGGSRILVNCYAEWRKLPVIKANVGGGGGEGVPGGGSGPVGGNGSESTTGPGTSTGGGGGEGGMTSGGEVGGSGDE